MIPSEAARYTQERHTADPKIKPLSAIQIRNLCRNGRIWAVKRPVLTAPFFVYEITKEDIDYWLENRPLPGRKAGDYTHWPKRTVGPPSGKRQLPTIPIKV